MDERFRVGNILEDVVTKERFKVIEVCGEEIAYITMLHLRYGLLYSQFSNQLDSLVLT